jgi:hypothetical protein
LEHYNNTILISADRNGSTAFQETLKPRGLNGDYEVFLGECFSQDPDKNQPPSWYDPDNYRPLQLVETVNKATGKPVVLKAQITFPNFTTEFLEIPAQRKIFLHRNLFDSTLSRCIAQLTGHWFTSVDNNVNTEQVEIPLDFFISRLEWRIDQYLMYLPAVLEWCNELYCYETYNYNTNLSIKPNTDKKFIVKNYDELESKFLSYQHISQINSLIDKKINYD